MHLNTPLVTAHRHAKFISRHLVLCVYFAVVSEAIHTGPDKQEIFQEAQAHFG